MEASAKSPIRVVICWPEISGYMAACWRALAATGKVDLTILALPSGKPGGGAFSDALVQGLPCHMLAPQQARDPAAVARLVSAARPQIVVLPGWAIPAYRRLPFSPELAGAKFVMGMDTPWRGELRQHLARLKIGRYLDRISVVIVAGERAWQYARRLKFPEARIRRGLYSFDYQRLCSCLEQRRQRGPWPRAFLFTGRYVPEKALDTLADAYRRYRALAPTPWKLVCCGRGPLAHLLKGVEGLEDRGFVQPGAMSEVYIQSGASVLPSRYEPWGVAVAEALAAGLPVIRTESCGSAVELVRHHYNGLLVPTDDAQALSRAMLWMDRHESLAAEMGARALPFAAAFSAELWASRWLEVCADLA